MVEPLVPDHVDARKTFAQRAHIKGIVPVSRLARFCELLADSAGQVQVSLQFGLDERHRRIIEGKIEASVATICQRCLEQTSTTLKESFKLGVVESEAQIDRLPDDVDPWLSEEPRLSLLDILEEQLMLAMPIVSYHPLACEALVRTDDGRENSKSGSPVQSDGNPFAILKKLKKPEKFN
jgi:uncharacterized protein